MLEPTYEVGRAFGPAKIRDAFFKDMLHPNDQEGDLAHYDEDDVENLDNDIMSEITTDEYGYQVDQVRQGLVVLSRAAAAKGWRSCIDRSQCPPFGGSTRWGVGS